MRNRHASLSSIAYHRGKKIVLRTLGFILSTLGSVPSNVFTVVLGTLNTFDGTDPKVDRVKPKVRNTIFSPLYIREIYIFCFSNAGMSVMLKAVTCTPRVRSLRYTTYFRKRFFQLGRHLRKSSLRSVFILMFEPYK